jgi:hypothetical protein
MAIGTEGELRSAPTEEATYHPLRIEDFLHSAGKVLEQITVMVYNVKR